MTLRHGLLRFPCGAFERDFEVDACDLASVVLTHQAFGVAFDLLF
jgi:hypothetical protein